MSSPIDLGKELSFEWLFSKAKGRGVKIAILDSGIDSSHPSIKGAVTQAYGLRLGKGGEPEAFDLPLNENNDVYGHGTGVAGIIHEIASEAELIDVRILNESNRVSSEEMLEGMRIALAAGADIINMSLGTPSRRRERELYELCERAYYRDALIIAARRNYGEIGFPAIFSNVISVNKTQSEGIAHVRYQRKNEIEFLAPGVEVKLIQPDNQEDIQTGSSFATPHVAGYVALIRELYSKSPSFEIKAVLKYLAVDVK